MNCWFNSPKQLCYLLRLVYRIKMTNNDILKKIFYVMKVIYKAKDYAGDGKLKETSVKGTEFIRMFLMHVLPRGFVNVISTVVI